MLIRRHGSRITHKNKKKSQETKSNAALPGSQETAIAIRWTDDARSVRVPPPILEHRGRQNWGKPMDIISVNTFWTILLIIHGLLAVALLGALTHQAMSVLVPVRATAGPGGFVTRFRAVQGAGYATAICVLYICTFIMGAWIYTKYRIYVRIPIEQAGYWKTQGFFDFKEHVATLGLVMLPAYWYFWKNAKSPEYDGARKGSTVVLAGVVWFLFLVGHVINNVRGFGS